MAFIVPLRVSRFAGATVAACLMSMSANAQDTSPWVNDTYSAVRLIAGSRSGAAFLGGIGFQLQPGWKTYWRNPGDSGVPPRIDFSKSENVESVTILWPAPKKFPDGAGGTSLGYQKQVLLPLRIVAKHADKPVTLRASINYAVCEKICVPVEANAELVFASVASTEDSAITAALDTVPKPSKIGDAGPLTVLDVKRDGKSVIVDVAATDSQKNVDLYVEGPTLDWALPIPKLIEHDASGVMRFGFDLDGLPPGASPEGAALKLTVVGSEGAYEFNTTLH
jgi:DsbC/DsbD-like thiol-disulfide interchange protein